MTRYLRYLIIFIPSIMVFMLLTAPASLVTEKIAKEANAAAEKSNKNKARKKKSGKEVKSAPLLTFYGVKGSAWNGEISSVSLGAEKIDNLKWDLGIFPLIIANLSADLDFEISGRPVKMAVSVGGYGAGDLSVEDLVADIDAPVFQKFANLHNLPLTLNGLIRFDVDEIGLTTDRFLKEGEGKISWLGAGATVGGEDIAFGDFEITMTTDGDFVVTKIKDKGKESPIMLDLVIKTSSNGDISIAGTGGYRDNFFPLGRAFLKECMKKTGDTVDVSGNLKGKNITKFSKQIGESFISCPLSIAGR